MLRKPPKDLLPDEDVFQVRFTKEVFREYTYPFVFFFVDGWFVRAGHCRVFFFFPSEVIDRADYLLWFLFSFLCAFMDCCSCFCCCCCVFVFFFFFFFSVSLTVFDAENI